MFQYNYSKPDVTRSLCVLQYNQGKLIGGQVTLGAIIHTLYPVSN